MIGFISCYGNYDINSRSQEEIEWLDQYFQWIVDFLNNNKEITHVILCWWYTSSDIESESESAKKQIIWKIPENISVVCENTSHKTYENFIFWYLSIRNHIKDKICFIWDNHRSEKITQQCEDIFWSLNHRIYYHFLERKDIHPNSNKDKQKEISYLEINTPDYKILKEYFMLQVSK